MDKNNLGRRKMEAILSPSAKNRQPWKFIAYTDLVSAIGEDGQLVGAVSLGYADEVPAARPRKKLEDVLEFR